MLARPKFLLAERVALEGLAPTPKNFAGRPIGMDAFWLQDYRSVASAA